MSCCPLTLGTYSEIARIRCVDNCHGWLVYSAVDFSKSALCTDKVLNSSMPSLPGPKNRDRRIQVQNLGAYRDVSVHSHPGPSSQDELVATVYSKVQILFLALVGTLARSLPLHARGDNGTGMMPDTGFFTALEQYLGSISPLIFHSLSSTRKGMMAVALLLPPSTARMRDKSVNAGE